MVVIAIIAILAGLLTTAGFAFVATAKEAATRTTITKVDEAILERVSGINRWNKRPYDKLKRDWENRGWIARWSNPPYSIPPHVLQGNTDAKQRLLTNLSHKEAMKEAFPITPGELKQCYWYWGQFESDGVPGITAAAENTASDAFLADMDGDAANGAQSLDRPGEIFLYALKNAPVFGGLPMVADDFRESELIDEPTDERDTADNDGLPELADAWGEPLRFYRWPTRLVKGNLAYDVSWAANVPRNTLMPNAPIGSLKQDPVDPLRQLARLGVTSRFHDPSTWSAPLIVSAGPDGQWGLAEPTEILSVPVPGGGTFPCVGLARPESIAGTGPGGAIAASPNANEELFDNLTNHNSDGGL